VAQVLPFLEPYFILRAIGGGIVVVSAFLFAINIIMTFLSKPLVQHETPKAEGNVQPL
jgi:cbb3-type cytochrome oxidase subunit 1